jgi:2-polyprenyl-3-methyl-5-hydroxy-6-metoxy-1,4-benzoquinol methylase
VGLIASQVAQQYERWIYPAPIPDLATYYASGIAEEAEPRMMHWLYWPDGYYAIQKKEKIDILVAGCGSNQAAKMAFTHPNARVVGIDMSQASLAHEHLLKEKHQLNNLTLHPLDLHDVTELKETPDQQFDFILCSGVLHHLPDPLSGLNALKKVLRPNGVMCVMGYGLYGRMGLYSLQEAFRLLELGQEPSDIDMVRSILSSLPTHHPVQPMLKNNLDVAFDAGLVDMFLHPMDHGFRVVDCLQWVQDVGMVFQGWLDRFLYEPAAWIQDAAVRTRLLALSKPEQWQVMELLNGGIRQHTFMVCHPERIEASYELDFNSPQFLNWIPVRRVHHFHPADPATNQPGWVQREPHHAVPLNSLQSALFQGINNANSIEACLQGLPPASETFNPVDYARTVFRSLWETGLVLFYCPPV